MRNVGETQPNGGRLQGDGMLFLMGLEQFIEREQIQSFVCSEDTSIIVSYDPSVSFSYTVCVYREGEDGLQALENISDYRSLEPGNYLFDFRLSAERDNDYFNCDALFRMCFQ